MPAHRVSIFIDREERSVIPGAVVGRDLLTLAGIAAPDQLLLDLEDEPDIPIAPADLLLIRGGERLVIGDGLPPVEDNPCLRHPIAFHFNGRPVPPASRFARAKVTGAELKALDPNLRPGDQLKADLGDLADEPIRDDQRVILQKADRFIVVPCGNVGLDDLVMHDVAVVAASYAGAELVEDSAGRYLIVPDVPVAAEYASAGGGPAGRTTLLIVIPAGYPMAAPDMFWVDPPLRLPGGGEPSGTSYSAAMAGRSWQRFSWHYAEGGAAWRPGVSNLLSHVAFCRARLARAY